MKFLIITLLICFNLFAGVKSNLSNEYPLGPLAVLTPGSLCDHPTTYRYPEQIPYCERNVNRELKEHIFQQYRNEGFRLNPGDRSSYKIDHLIPLCAGGSNHQDNLWPQHRTVYLQTDLLEGLGCEKLKAARIKQSELIKLILAAKKDLTLVDQTLSFLKNI
jgi:hypothetical protein